MSKAERTFNLKESILSLFKKTKKQPVRSTSEGYDPAALAFARLGLLAYYANPL